VPVALAPELGNKIANLEIMPRTMNRRKGATMGQRQRDYARRFAAIEMLSTESLRRIPGGR
jgi:hypothetical protein